jgi:2-oxoglutarate dehydrogenase E1 component
MSESEPNLNCLSADYLESLLEDYLRDPSRVPPGWREYFERFNGEPAGGRAGFRTTLPRRSLFHAPAPRGDGRSQRDFRTARLQDRVDQLIRAYRVRGHLMAQLNPLGPARPQRPDLTPEFYGLTPADLDRPFSTVTLGGQAAQTLREILSRLRNTYCRSIGVQFMHIDDLAVKNWLQERMEPTENRIELSRRQQIRILTRLTDAVIFEQFVRRKYVGAKTFSLEGSESLIPLLHLAIDKAADDGIREIVLAMGHRGRLNVLVNIVGKSPQEVFWEFEDSAPELQHGRGDVKYHLGHSGNWVTTDGKKVHLSLAFNPSHLEFVSPVALGRLRAKQDRFAPGGHEKGMAILVHGDASLAGEGVMQETLNMSELAPYTTGGALHVVVNNQIGFTTPPEEGRSSTYATDVFRMLQVPIFHVNGEDPEAVAQAVWLALEFRKAFHRDVVIDMYGYRRQGHNESDEPTFTQPVMYRKIRKRPSVRDAYLEHLLQLDGLTRDEADQIARRRYELLEEAFDRARQGKPELGPEMLTGVWKGYLGGSEPADDEPPTGVSRKRLAELLVRTTEVPEGFHVHPKLKRGMNQRREMAEGKTPLDWASAEAMAIATLAVEGHRVRLSGQDTARGTFSQRHAVLFDQEDGRPYMPLAHLAADQAPVEVINSPLSETGPLGFEYGYSLDCPEGLIAWEAQFGDFVNAGQVIIDQFLASAEDKWRRLSGLVLLLPHGFEGQGPEHSSARLERFLTLAAEDNMQVVQPTTPAQYFHVLRRQVLRRWRKPLVVLTPKSLLRHPRVVSALEQFETDRFHRVLPDDEVDPEAVTRIVLSSGKVYYDLRARREEAGRSDVALMRIEQFYPLPELSLRAALERYAEGTPAVWVQDEPENMGAWRFLRHHLGDSLFGLHPLSAVTRPASASPATGSSGSHKIEQEELLLMAFGRG